jgi:MFS family permease
MNDEGSAAYNPEHEDDRIERRIADQPDTQPNRWVRRIVLLLVLAGVAYLAYLMAAAFFPRWWAQRIADQVDGRVTRGTMWGLFYGFVFTAVPLLILAQARRRFLSWTWRAVVAVLAIVLAAPNWLTLSVVAGNSNAAHAGERILDVDGPGFRAGTLIGVIVGAVVVVALTAAELRLKARKQEVKRLRGERDELRRSHGEHDGTR